LLASGEFDEARVFAQMDEVAKAESEIKKQRFGLMLRLRQILTPEQRKKLDELKQASHGKQGRRLPAPQKPRLPAHAAPSPAAN
jgi:Spy/CpxP family protein refolding chaperone